MSVGANQATGAAVPVWDPLVRILHWTLAIGVLIGFATGDHGGRWHERVGYVALGAALLRIVWGFVGTRYARFGDFVPGPSRLVEYLRSLWERREPRYLGHNPLGGAWIVLMIALVVGTGGTGVMLSILGEHEVEVLEDLHEALANTLVAAVVVHLAGVAWESVRHGENLVRAMLTGRKRPAGPQDR